MMSKHKYRYKALVSCLLPFALMACGLGPVAESDRPNASENLPAISEALGSDEVLSRIRPMPSQQIPAGQCGLFLWAKRQDTPLVFFQRSSGETFMHFDAQVVGLTRTSATNQIAMQFFRSQTFSVADLTIKIDLNPEQVRSLQQGLKIPSGSMTITTDDGWSAAIPVAGAIGCQ